MEEPSTQTMVNDFGMLVTGGQVLPEGDPRIPWIAVAQIALQEYVGLTAYAYKAGLVNSNLPENEHIPDLFTPQFGEEDE